MGRRYDNNVEHYRRLVEAKLNGDAVQKRWQKHYENDTGEDVYTSSFHPPNQYPQDTDFEHKKNEVATKVKVAKILIDIYSRAEKEDGIDRRHLNIMV